jgi:hypothetical protein
MMNWILRILDALLTVFPDAIREWLAARRERKEEKAKRENDLKDSVESGDPDRIAHDLCRRLRD